MKSSIATAFLSLVFGPFGIFCLAWAFIYSARGELLSAVVALSAAASLLSFVAMLGLVASRKVIPRVAAGPEGSEIMIAIEAPGKDERYFVIACGIATLIGTFSLRQLARHRSASFLRMTIDGIETGNTMTTAVRSWDEIADITDRPRNAGRPNGATYLVTADGRTRELPSHWYTPGGIAIHALVRFYWEHPEARDELTDGRALARLEAERHDG
jgi:hypothetical protein